MQTLGLSHAPSTRSQSRAAPLESPTHTSPPTAAPPRFSPFCRGSEPDSKSPEPQPQTAESDHRGVTRVDTHEDPSCSCWNKNFRLEALGQQRPEERILEKSLSILGWVSLTEGLEPGRCLHCDSTRMNWTLQGPYKLRSVLKSLP